MIASTSRSSSSPRRLGLLLAVALLLAACGGGGSAPLPDEPFSVDFPVDTPGNGGVVPPPPAPPPSLPEPVFDPDAYVHERSVLFGSFPSDVVRHGTTIFTTDADQIDEAGARVVAVDVSGPAPVPSTRFAGLSLEVDDLVTTDGVPASLDALIGFGWFLNDILVVADDLAFVLAAAGGSDSDPGLANLVVFDPTTGTIRQIVDLATPVLPGSGAVDSTGAPIPASGFRQSQPEAIAFVPAAQGRGFLYVAMANLVFGPPSFGTTRYPGTVQVYNVDPAQAAPVAPRATGMGATQTLVLDGYNPVALTTILGEPSPLGGPAPMRVLVTIAGASAFDDTFALVPVTPAAVAVYDGPTATFLGRFEMGLTGLAAARPGIGRDRVGHRVGYFPSAVTGEVYLLLLDGLYTPVVDPTRLRVLRGPANGIAIVPQASGTPGANITAVGLAPDGRHLVVAGFGDLFAFPEPESGRLYLLSLPDDVVTGGVHGSDFVPGARLYGTAAARAIGALALVPGVHPRPEVYVAVSGPIDGDTFLGTGPASLGTLDTFDRVR